MSLMAIAYLSTRIGSDLGYRPMVIPTALAGKRKAPNMAGCPTSAAFGFVGECARNDTYRVKLPLVRPVMESRHCRRKAFPLAPTVPAQRPLDRMPTTLTQV